MTYRDDRAALEMRRADLERELGELRETARTTTARTERCEAELEAVLAALGGAGPDRSVEAIRRRSRKVLAIALGGATLASLVAVWPISEKPLYALSVSRVLADAPRFEGRRLRVEGTLVHGSVERQDAPCEYRFRLASDGVEMPVRDRQCVVPDIFGDTPSSDVKVIVEGELLPGRSFEATRLMARGGRMGYATPRASSSHPQASP
jgi:cytochrome c-type biogenesis protein CcmE